VHFVVLPIATGWKISRSRERFSLVSTGGVEISIANPSRCLYDCLRRAGKVPEALGQSKTKIVKDPSTAGRLAPERATFQRGIDFPRGLLPNPSWVGCCCAYRRVSGGRSVEFAQGLFLDSSQRSSDGRKRLFGSSQIRIGMTTASVFSSLGGVIRAGERSSWNESRTSFDWIAPIASSMYRALNPTVNASPA
jgi:hypothetical protein